MARTAPASRAHKAEPPRPPPRSTLKGVVKRCNECVASHTRCNRARPTCERCQETDQACSWPEKEAVDITGANTLRDHFLPTTTTMNPPSARDNPALRLLNALNASYASEPSQPAAASQSFLLTRPATSSEQPASPSEQGQDNSPLAHGAAPSTILNSSLPQAERVPNGPVPEITLPDKDEDDDMTVMGEARNRNETLLGYGQPRRIPGVIYMGNSRIGREEPLLPLLPR